MLGIVLSTGAVAAGKAASSELPDECSKNADPVCWENNVPLKPASLLHLQPGFFFSRRGQYPPRTYVWSTLLNSASSMVQAASNSSGRITCKVLASHISRPLNSEDYANESSIQPLNLGWGPGNG